MMPVPLPDARYDQFTYPAENEAARIAMRHEQGRVFLEIQDAIRMNRLVRRGTDFQGFVVWYNSMDVSEQAEMIGELCHFAYEAGVNDQVYRETSASSGLAEDDPSVRLFKQVRSGGRVLNLAGLKQWLKEADQAARYQALRWFAHLFCVAERRVLTAEAGRPCNHWWHKDLDDPRVIESILNEAGTHNSLTGEEEKR